MVTIAGKCSGVEGMALMLGLTVGWLIFSRRELRMARAVLLVPASILTVFLLNMVRIAALIALGDAGYGTVAVSGFHSEAGWIFFSAVALVFLALVNRGNSAGLSQSVFQRQLADGASEQFSTTENSLIVFEGARVRHRATPAAAGDLRLILGGERAPGAFREHQ